MKTPPAIINSLSKTKQNIQTQNNKYHVYVTTSLRKDKQKF